VAWQPPANWLRCYRSPARGCRAAFGCCERRAWSTSGRKHSGAFTVFDPNRWPRSTIGTDNTRGEQRVMGTMRSVDGKGIVRMQDRFDTDIDDLWSALTDPGRLARWLGEVDGDLRVDAEFRARFFSSGWEGTGGCARVSPRSSSPWRPRTSTSRAKVYRGHADRRRRPDDPGRRGTGHTPELTSRLRGRDPGSHRRSRRPPRRA